MFCHHKHLVGKKEYKRNVSNPQKMIIKILETSVAATSISASSSLLVPLIGTLVSSGSAGALSFAATQYVGKEMLEKNCEIADTVLDIWTEQTLEQKKKKSYAK